jgi:hypothetical protein
MKLYGQDVPQSVIDAANAAMKGRFTNGDISTAIAPLFSGWFDVWTIAARLLQRARKAGKIRYEGGYWHEV